MTTVSNRPGKLTWAITLGDDISLTLTFEDAAGDPIDLSGRTYAASVLDTSLSSVATVTVGTGSAAAGILVLSLTDAQTDLLTPRGYFWKLVETDGSTTTTLLDGPFSVSAGGQAGIGSGSSSATVTVSQGADVTVTVTAGQVAASSLAFTPSGTIAASNVQAAIVEVATDAAALVDDLSGVTSPGTARTNLGLGTAAVADSTDFGVEQSQLRGNRSVWLGDSIMVSSETVADQRAISIPTYATILSSQRLNYVRNAGVAGDTADEMLARFDTDVGAYSPSIVVILAGTNDTTLSTPIADYATAIEGLVAKCRALGALPILCTIPPNDNVSGTPADRQAQVGRINAYLARFCAQQGLPLVDMFTLLVDETDGEYLSTYFNDGTHPNNAGYAALGALVVDTLDGHLPPVDMWLPGSDVDPNNLITHGCFGGTFSSGIPQGWSVVSSAHRAGVVGTLDQSDTTIKGNWYVQTATASTLTDTTFQTVSGIVAGHRYAFMGRVKATGMTGGMTVSARLLFGGSTGAGNEFRAMSALGENIDDGVFYIEGECPSGKTDVQVNLQLNPGTGVYKLAQLGLYDLTDLGLD